jgi:hypothetical protein
MKVRTKLLGLSAAALAVAVTTYAFTASSEESHGGFGPHAMRHGMGRMMGPGMMDAGMMGPGMMGRGMMGHAHDQATMQQMQDIHRLLANHARITRTVTNLPNGIRTVTESDDAEIAQLLKTHTAEMIGRVEAGDNPNLPMQSPELHAIFRNKDKIRTNVETTAKGVVVVQTSNDPDTVATLQKHASQVTDLVRGGMAAMHTAMMKNTGGAMHGGMMGGGMMDHDMMHGWGMMHGQGATTGRMRHGAR